MIKKIISIFIFFILLSPSVYAQNIPTIKPYVNDFVGVLSPEEANSINFLAGEIEKNTTVQVAVLIVNSTQPLAIEDYSNQVFRANGIGHRDNNNGLLIVVAVADRKWRIEVGYGLEGTINDAKAGDIGRTYFTPNFQQDQYGTGIYLAVQSIAMIVQGSDDPYLISTQSSYSSPVSDLILSNLPWLIFILIFLLPGIFAHYARCPKCGAWTSGKFTDQQIVYVCKNGHRWTKKRRSRFFWPLLLLGGGGGSSGGGGGFGGGSSGGGGASGGF